MQTASFVFDPSHIGIGGGVMIQAITRNFYGAFANELLDMHRLRYRVFKERLQWNVQFNGEVEVDEYDALDPVYLIQRANGDRVQGCVRLLPSNGPTMIRDTFPTLLGGHPLPTSNSLWESSRFAIDVGDEPRSMMRGLTSATYELFAGMIEFGLSRRLVEIVTVTDTRMERILRRAGWPLRRAGEPIRLGRSDALAGYLEVSEDALARVCDAGNVRSPVLWEPALGAA